MSLAQCAKVRMVFDGVPGCRLPLDTSSPAIQTMQVPELLFVGASRQRSPLALGLGLWALGFGPWALGFVQQLR